MISKNRHPHSIVVLSVRNHVNGKLTMEVVHLIYKEAKKTCGR